MAKYTPKTTEELKALVQDESIYLGDIDTSAITDMAELFAKSERRDFSGIESWDVSNVMFMSRMFSGAKYFNHNINSWDTSNVLFMDSLFAYAENFNQPLDKWDTSNVVGMSGMFAYATSFNQPLNQWDTSNVVSMLGIFNGATNFNQPLDKWDTSNVKFMSIMFMNATNFNQDLSAWNVANVIDNQGMFKGCPAKQPQQWTHKVATQNLEELGDMARIAVVEKAKEIVEKIANKLKKPNLQKSSNGKYTPKTTEELKALVQDESIYLGDIDTSAITDMENLFAKSERKDFSGIESWDISNVLNMSGMFWQTKYFNHNINSWDTSSVIDMSFMFMRAENFNQPLDKWDTSSAINMEAMFKDAENFNQPLDSWDVSNVEFMLRMFYNAKSFNQNLNSWDINSVRDNQQMFWHSGVESLPKWWKNRILGKKMPSGKINDERDEIEAFIEERMKQAKIQAKANPRSKEQKQREKEQAKQQKAWFKPKAENSAKNQAEQEIGQESSKKKPFYTSTIFLCIVALAIGVGFGAIKSSLKSDTPKQAQSSASTQTQQPQTPPKPTITMPSCDDNGVKQYINDTQRQGVRQKLQSDADAWASVQAHARASGRDFASIDEYMNSLIFYFSSTQTTSRDEAAQRVECSAQVLADFPFPQARFELKYSAQITPQGTRVDVTNAQLLNQAPEISSVASDAAENAAASSSAPSESVNSSENLNAASESAQSAIKPSFDCAKASSSAEKLVCSDSELASLDLALSNAYTKARSSLNAAGKKQLTSEQKKWLETYNQCTDKACVKRNLEQRIQALQGVSSVRLKTNDEYVNLRKAPSGEVLTPIYKKDFDKITIKRLDGGDAKWLKVLYFPPNTSDESKAITGYIHISQIDESSL